MHPLFVEIFKKLRIKYFNKKFKIIQEQSEGRAEFMYQAIFIKDGCKEYRHVFRYCNHLKISLLAPSEYAVEKKQTWIIIK